MTPLSKTEWIKCSIICRLNSSYYLPGSVTSSRRSSDQLDLMVDGLPVSLPSYEEAVYGSWGQRLPACSAPGPTQLLLAQGAGAAAAGCHQSSSSSPLSDSSQRPLLSGQSPDNPPPPYEEVQVPRRPPSLSDDKDTWRREGAVAKTVHRGAVGTVIHQEDGRMKRIKPNWRGRLANGWLRWGRCCRPIRPFDPCGLI